MNANHQQLLERIRLGEDSRLELKRVVMSGGKIKGPRQDDLADEIVALANSFGGTLVLGVDDKTCDIVGFSREHQAVVEEMVAAALRDSISPPLMAETDILEFPGPDGDPVRVLTISVPRGLAVHKGPGGYWHRISSSKQQMTPEHLRRLNQQRSLAGLQFFDETPVPHADLGVFDLDLTERFRSSRNQDERPVLLRKLGMVSPDQDDVLRPTVAGVLFGVQNPEQILPQAFIQAVAYRGTAIEGGPGYQLDAADLVGPLDVQVIDACRFVAKNMRVVADKVAGRLDHPQFDITAVFEAMVNAVAHRDYSIAGSKIRLRLFADRLEFFVPGGLVNSLELEDLAYQQNARNPVITSLLAKLPIPSDIPWLETTRTTFMDRRGEGVPLVLERGEAIAGRPPVYELTGTSQLRLTLYGARISGADPPSPDDS